MKQVVFVLMTCLLFFVSACSEHRVIRETNIEFENCSQGCEIKQEKCQESCRNNCVQCSAHANQTSKLSYRQYQREQVIRGGTIARQLKSYRDPLQCRKTTCNCKADYQVCIQACGGKIHKELRAAPVC